MEEGKKFVITENERDEVLKFIIARNFNPARNILLQLRTLKEYLKENRQKEVTDGTF